MTTDGDAYLGGENVDNIIAQHIKKEISNNEEYKGAIENPKIDVILKKEAMRIKELFSCKDIDSVDTSI